MADKNKDNDKKEHDEFEEEFSFDSDEAQMSTDDPILEDEPLPEAEAAPAPAEQAKSKSIMLPTIIAAAVIGFIGWKGYQKFFQAPPNVATGEIKPATPVDTTKVTTTTSTTPVPSPVTETPTATATTTTTTTVPSAVAQPPITHPATVPSVEQKPLNSNNVTTSPIAIPELDKKDTVSFPTTTPVTTDGLAQLQKKVDDQDKALKQQLLLVEKQISDITKSTGNTAQSIGALQNDMAALTRAMKDLSAQMQASRTAPVEKAPVKITKKKQSKPKKESAAHVGQKADSNPSFAVYAIIPGRAWLRSPNGKTITVSEGDTVGHYGKVLKIDAGNGVVVTTSGVTLR